MTCREITEFLHDYFSDELPGPERAEFDKHLAVCPQCVAYIDSYKKTIEIGRSLSTVDSAAAAPEDLVQAILRARSRKSP